MDPANTVSYLLSHTAAVMDRQSDQLLQERLGIGMAQFKVLTTLQERANVQQRFLAVMLGQTEASVSRQIKLLLEKGLLSVQVNPADKRKHVTALTAKGVKLAQAAREIVDANHEPALDGLSKKERQQLGELLQQLHLYYCGEGKSFACSTPWKDPT